MWRLRDPEEGLAVQAMSLEARELRRAGVLLPSPWTRIS